MFHGNYWTKEVLSTASVLVANMAAYIKVTKMTKTFHVPILVLTVFRSNIFNISHIGVSAYYMFKD